MSGHYLMMSSVHGLVRGRDPELGRDADTGGQVLYVVELARALAARPDVERVDLITRRIDDRRVDPGYAEPIEQIAPKAFIVRVPFGPKEYLRKELLWPHLDSCADAILQHVRRAGRTPDVIHGHYADAGYVGSRVAALLGIPFIFTGHSLGRVKRSRLLAQGQDADAIESHYHITRRIEAEELALDSASFVVASTRQEVDEQYAVYDNHHPRRMIVIPPGVDLGRFRPPFGRLHDGRYAVDLARFLRDPDKPIVLAIARADEKKNLAALVSAFGSSPRLRELANLIILAGTRDDLEAMERGSRKVLTELLTLIDRYDLYGSVAYPKQHTAADVPDIYRLAARSRGVFVNPALTEPFGLTLLEAAASGLPVVATQNGGPKEIIAKCRCGALIDPLDEGAMARTLITAVANRTQWRRWSKQGARLAPKHYSWRGHANAYVSAVREVLGTSAPPRTARAGSRSEPTTFDRALITDIDGTLIGDRASLSALLARIDGHRRRLAFCVATGRSIDSAHRVLAEWGVPPPDAYISSVGSEIHHGPRRIQDLAWTEHIDHLWDRAALARVLGRIAGLTPQPRDCQGLHKLSYFYDAARAPSIAEIRSSLRSHDLHANLIYSNTRFLDVLPIRASKGLAARYLALEWGLAPERLLVAGDSGNDVEMLTGNTLAVVVGNHASDLSGLRGWPSIYFSPHRFARGIVDGIEHYDFLANARTAPSTVLA